MIPIQFKTIRIVAVDFFRRRRWIWTSQRSSRWIFSMTKWTFPSFVLRWERSGIHIFKEKATILRQHMSDPSSWNLNIQAIKDVRRWYKFSSSGAIDASYIVVAYFFVFFWAFSVCAEVPHKTNNSERPLGSGWMHVQWLLSPPESSFRNKMMEPSSLSVTRRTLVVNEL